MRFAEIPAGWLRGMALCMIPIIMLVYVFAHEKTLERERLSRLHRHIDVVASSLWDHDVRSIKNYLNVASELEGYDQIVISDNDGCTRLHLEEPSRENRLDILLHEIGLIRTKTIAMPVYYNDRRLAEIYVRIIDFEIYNYMYVFLVLFLCYAVFEYFLRVLHAKRGLEARVAERTSELSRLNARFRQNEEMLRFISDNIPDGLVYEIDSGVDGRQRKFTYISAGVSRLHELSADEVIQTPSKIYEQIHEDDRKLVAEKEAEALRRMNPLSIEVRVVLPSGAARWRLFASSPRPLPNGHTVWDGVEIDITERKKTDESLRRIQSLESLGTVAGGIAHDFNNLLMGVFGNIELAMLELKAGDPAFASLQSASQSIEDARHLASRLLTFAKGGSPMLEALDLRERIKESVQFNLHGSNVAANFNIPDDLWQVKADKGQIAQVFSNLTINSREAMPAGGNIHIDAENVPDIAKFSVPNLKGKFVRISFRDEGTGIPTGIVGRIFDPYFSTKKAGSGLGLSVVHGIISKHGGHIGVESVPGRGTTFTIFLPADAAQEKTGALSAVNAAPRREKGRPLRILVMDDEKMILETASGMLRKLGHYSETATNGAEALAKYRDAMHNGAHFDIVILDLTIPGGMGGVETIKKLLEMHPAAKAIVASGYSSDSAISDYGSFGFAGCLVKPIRLQELSDAIVRVAES